MEKVLYKIKFGIMGYCGSGFREEELTYSDLKLAITMFKKMRKWKRQLEGAEGVNEECSRWVDDYDGYLHHLYGLYRVIETKLEIPDQS